MNNLLLNSCYSGWIITPKLRKDDFSKSSILKRKKWSYKYFAAERTWTEITRSRILRLSTWAICELMNAGGKKLVKSVWPQWTTDSPKMWTGARFGLQFFFFFFFFFFFKRAFRGANLSFSFWLIHQKSSRALFWAWWKRRDFWGFCFF